MKRFTLLLAVVAVTACGIPESAVPPDSPGPAEATPPGEADQRYRGSGMVLEAKGDDPVLCLGAVLDSLPPQCGGIPIAGWDWNAVSDEESASGATWGYFEVTGFYDGEIFTLIETRPPRPRGTEEDPIESGCPEPAGGWERPDPGLTSEGDYRKAIRESRREPDFAGAWVDYIDEPTEFTDPQNIILNLAFTGDLGRHEAEIRHRWGGPLCVVKREHTLRRLRRIQKELHGPVGQELGLEILFSDAGEYRNVVEVGVVVIDAATRKEIDDRYGEGVVDVTAQLQPVP